MDQAQTSKLLSFVLRHQPESVVAASDEQRFVIDRAADRIRANQGHSIDVDLGLRFAVSANGVWLTDRVPACYLSMLGQRLTARAK